MKKVKIITWLINAILLITLTVWSAKGSLFNHSFSFNAFHLIITVFVISASISLIAEIVLRKKDMRNKYVR